jgi:integrase
MAKVGCTLEPLTFDSKFINNYLAAMEDLRFNTYRSAKNNLSMFPRFVRDTFKQEVDEVIENIKAGKQDKYQLLAAYIKYGRLEKKTDARIRQLVSAVRSFLEYHDIEIPTKQMKLKVKMPEKITRMRRPVSKNQIAEILLAASNIELKTCLMILAATGMRPIEAFSIRHRDIDFQADPARFYIRGEYTKTGNERYVFITVELRKQLEVYLAYKTRERRITYNDATLGHKKMITITGKIRPDDLLLGIYHRDEKHLDVKPTSLYIKYVTDFNQLLDSTGRGEKVNSTYEKSWRHITFYSFRRYVKTAISNAGFADFGEWLIGHSGSVYWSETDEKKAEIFKKVEPFISYLDVAAIEARGADVQSQLEILQEQLHRQEFKTKEILVLFARYMSTKNEAEKPDLADRLLNLGFRV